LIKDVAMVDPLRKILIRQILEIKGIYRYHTQKEGMSNIES
jgi:hypothetical protein